MFQFLGESKFQKASKLLHWVKSDSDFGERGGFYLGVELQWEGSEPAACAAGLFQNNFTLKP